MTAKDFNLLKRKLYEVVMTVSVDYDINFR